MQEPTHGKEGMTYEEAVERWADEREALRYVQAYTAQRSRQKALLFAPWIGGKAIDDIEPADILCALAELGSGGGRLKEGLSSATLRAAHLAGLQAAEWAVAHGHAASNPFGKVKRPKANYRQSRFLTQREATELATKVARNAETYMMLDDVRRASFCLAVYIALARGCAGARCSRSGGTTSTTTGCGSACRRRSRPTAASAETLDAALFD